MYVMKINDENDTFFNCTNNEKDDNIIIIKYLLLQIASRSIITI